MIWKTDITSHAKDGVSWQSWFHWEWQWRLCGFGYKGFYYDGQHDVREFGIGSLYRGLDSSYHEARRAQS